MGTRSLDIEEETFIRAKMNTNSSSKDSSSTINVQNAETVAEIFSTLRDDASGPGSDAQASLIDVKPFTSQKKETDQGRLPKKIDSHKNTLMNIREEIKNAMKDIVSDTSKSIDQEVEKALLSIKEVKTKVNEKSKDSTKVTVSDDAEMQETKPSTS